MVIAGALGGWAWAMIPAVLKTRFRTNEILVSLLLVYVAERSWPPPPRAGSATPTPWAFREAATSRAIPGTDNPEIIAGTGMHWGVLAAFIAVIAAYVLMNRHVLGYQIRLAGQAPRAARFAGVEPNRLVLLCLGISGALAGRGPVRGLGPAGQISIDFNVGLRLHRDHRGLPRAAAPDRHPARGPADGADLYRRRTGAAHARRARRPRSRPSRGCSCSSCSRSTSCRTTASS
jgi:ribose/xylose/arabinose/galactoside ABC-type transport system permease subunit